MDGVWSMSDLRSNETDGIQFGVSGGTISSCSYFNFRNTFVWTISGVLFNSTIVYFVYFI